MIDLKRENGVTLIALSITLIVLMIVTGITISSSKNQLAIKKVNNLYADIDSISSKVADYYLENNSLPIFENQYVNDKTELETLFKNNKGDGDSINVNDDGAYYVINLIKLSNLTLNYGKQYKDWNISSSPDELQDLYIINETTHQIYYPEGIKYQTAVFFTDSKIDVKVDGVQVPTISEENIRFNVNSANKIVSDDNKANVYINITLSVDENFMNNTMQFCIKNSDDTENIEYTSFEGENPTLMSEKLENSEYYDLYIKVFDIYGTEHILKKDKINIT